MCSVQKVHTGNRLLDSLPAKELSAFIAASTEIELGVWQLVREAGKRITHAYFPIDCVISITAGMQNGSEVEVGSIGREGLLGARSLTRIGHAVNPSYCSVAGRARRIGVSAFRGLAPEGSRLRERTLEYNEVLAATVGQLSACNRFHQPVEHWASWLLLARDRASRETFEITHAQMGRVLGISRPPATLAAVALQRTGAIRYTRGRLTILNRKKLEAASCECYRRITAEFKKLYTGA